MEAVETINTLNNAYNMGAFETIYALHAIGQRVDVQWGFFISIHMALLGGIVYVDRPLKIVEKIILLFVYSGFALMNCFLTISQGLQQLAAYKQLEDLAAQAGKNAQSMLQHYGQLNQSASETTYLTITVATHLIMAIIVMFSVIMDNADKK